VSSNIILDKDLKIHNVEDIKDELLRKLDVKGDITIDLSSVEKIDISGLQLLISIVAELKELKKDYLFIGEFKSNFSQDLNKICFSPNIISNGSELQSFIEDGI